MQEYQLRIATPAGIVYDGPAHFLSLRGAAGDLAIMAGHIPFVTSVKPGRCKLRLPDETERIGECSGGMLTVGQDRVSLLTSAFRWETEKTAPSEP